LGEVSFLRNSTASADVFAETQVEAQGRSVVNLYYYSSHLSTVIDAQRLRALFVQQPALAGRCYRKSYTFFIDFQSVFLISNVLDYFGM
jgi:hypothetical protein